MPGGGIVAILLSLLLTLTAFTSEAQCFQSVDRTEASIYLPPVDLTIHVQDIGPNYQQATIYSANETRTIYIQTQNNTQNRFAPPADDWIKMARRADTNSNLIFVEAPLYVALPPLADEPYHSTLFTPLTDEEVAKRIKESDMKYGRTLAEMRIKANK